MTDRAISPNALSKQLGIRPQKVLGWIARGELRAHNLAERTGGRPRWKILPEHLAEFLAARSSGPPPAPAARRRKRMTGVTQYY